MRYIVMLDPADQWLVYDTVADLPAEVAGRLLIGLPASEADRLAAAVNITAEIEKWRYGEYEFACDIVAAARRRASDTGARTEILDEAWAHGARSSNPAAGQVPW